MAQKTNIKRDSLGLYVNAGGWIARPFFGTIFQEGDEVKTHHFNNGTDAGVTFLDQNFKKDGKYEHWITTGIMADKHKQTPIKEIKKDVEWYINFAKSMVIVYEPLNTSFRTEFGSRLK